MLKVGIIGCGQITQVRHAPEFANNPHCELVGFYGHRPGSAQKLADRFGGRAFDSMDELLASVDAVSVCTANYDHAATVIRALRAGKHVLCEKPMAMTLEDCETMVQLAKENSRTLMIAQNQRFAKAHIAGRDFIASGKLGRISTFRVVYAHPGPEGWTGVADPWFFHKDKAVLGVMADLGIHKTDLLHYLLGESIVEVSAKLVTREKTYPDGTLIDVDDNAFCIYTTESGITGSLNISWTNHGPENNSTVICGTEGNLRLYDDPEYTMIFESKDGHIERFTPDRLLSNEEVTGGVFANSGVIDSFVHSILTGTPSPVEGSDAIRAMRVIFAAAESDRTGHAVKI